MSMGGRVTVLILRIVAGLIFCYAGWIKLWSPQPFADSIATFQLLPPLLISLLALGLPPFEITIGVLLVCGWKLRLAAFCGLTACGVFLLALLAAAIRGLSVECGCFGETPSSLPPAQRLWMDVGRDLLLLGALWVVYQDARHQD